MMDFMESISRARKRPFDPRLVRIRLPALHATRILSGLLTDLLHPGDEGMQEIGENLAAFIRRSTGNGGNS